jgi:hypothetical protein
VSGYTLGLVAQVHLDLLAEMTPAQVRAAAVRLRDRAEHQDEADERFLRSLAFGLDEFADDREKEMQS